MNIQCSLEIREEATGQVSSLTVSLKTAESAQVLIGKDGQNLKALESILRLMTWRAFPDEPAPILLDVNGYRKDRSLQVVKIARSAVARVRDTRKPEALIPMSSYERRMIHSELASYPDIITESIGEEPQRRIVVKLLK